jgi:hypothetical protein
VQSKITSKFFDHRGYPLYSGDVLRVLWESFSEPRFYTVCERPEGRGTNLLHYAIPCSNLANHGSLEHRTPLQDVLDNSALCQIVQGCDYNVETPGLPAAPWHQRERENERDE